MKILVVTESYFDHMGISMTDRSRLDTIKAVIRSLLFIVVLGPLLGGASAAFIYYYPNRFGEYVRALMGICAGVPLAAKLLNLKMNERRLKILFENLRKTVDEGLLLK